MTFREMYFPSTLISRSACLDGLEGLDLLRPLQSERPVDEMADLAETFALAGFRAGHYISDLAFFIPRVVIGVDPLRHPCLPRHSGTPLVRDDIPDIGLAGVLLYAAQRSLIILATSVGSLVGTLAGLRCDEEQAAFRLESACRAGARLGAAVAMPGVGLVIGLQVALSEVTESLETGLGMTLAAFGEGLGGLFDVLRGTSMSAPVTPGASPSGRRERTPAESPWPSPMSSEEDLIQF